MTRLRIVLSWIFAAGAGAGLAVAEEVAGTAQKSAAPQPRPRLISPTVAAQLSAAMPRFDFSMAQPAAAEPIVDLREIDPPRNDIVRLPRYLVLEDKPLVLKERQLLTPRGRLDVALKKFPGLRFGSFWIFRNDGWALAMLAEEERLERRREMFDLISLLPVAHFRWARSQVEQAFIRSPNPR